MKKTLTSLGAFFLLVLCLWSESQAQESLSQTKSFAVRKGGALEVSVGGGDIIINSWEKSEVLVKTIGLDEADSEALSITQLGNTVHVEFDPEEGCPSTLRFDITIPSQFDIDVNTAGGNLDIRGPLAGYLEGSTSGGDIRLGEINGTCRMNTSGGDIISGKIQGDINLNTFAGDIRLGTVSGDAHVNTSGGDIKVDYVGKRLHASTSGGDIHVGDVGGEAIVSTSGGDVRVGKVSGSATLTTSGGNIELRGASGSVKANTSGGDLWLRNITGSIDAMTSGGNVEAELIPSGKGTTRLISSSGNVVVYVPENSKATIEARIRTYGWSKRKGKKYKAEYDVFNIISDFKADPSTRGESEGEIRATYTLNGGGERVLLETSNGNIEIRKLLK